MALGTNDFVHLVLLAHGFSAKTIILAIIILHKLVVLFLHFDSFALPAQKIYTFESNPAVLKDFFLIKRPVSSEGELKEIWDRHASQRFRWQSLICACNSFKSTDPIISQLSPTSYEAVCGSQANKTALMWILKTPQTNAQ